MISLKAVENLLGFSYPTIPAISAIDIFVVTKSWECLHFIFTLKCVDWFPVDRLKTVLQSGVLIPYLSAILFNVSRLSNWFANSHFSTLIFLIWLAE